MKAEVKQCKCINSYQDNAYGAGNRVCNPTAKKSTNDPQRHRCTVCGTVH